jgi:acetate kinase
VAERARADIALCLNAGSSSLKFALFRSGDPLEECLASGAIEQVGTKNARASLKAAGKQIERPCESADPGASFNLALSLLDELSLPEATVVSHRVVHGGPTHVRPTRIDADLVSSLKALVPWAPLHLPAAILGIEAVSRRLPAVPQVACFDTAFHAGMPEHAKRFALPAHFYAEGVRRYGFHGLSYEYVLSTLGNPVPPRIIIAHLGNGASLAAIRDGCSVDTTMGFTPAGGILMGTRAGDLDPVLVLYLLREKAYSADTLENLLDRQSGLLGIAGTADMQILAEREASDDKARLAIAMLGYAVKKTIGAYIAVLGGLDLLVFTGGIGEHAPSVRAEACRGLDALGIALDSAKNTQNESAIHAETSVCPVLVIKTDEDRMLARHAHALLRG